MWLFSYVSFQILFGFTVFLLFFFFYFYLFKKKENYLFWEKILKLLTVLSNTKIYIYRTIIFWLKGQKHPWSKTKVLPRSWSSPAQWTVPSSAYQRTKDGFRTLWSEEVKQVQAARVSHESSEFQQKYRWIFGRCNTPLQLSLWFMKSEITFWFLMWSIIDTYSKFIFFIFFS